VGRPVPGHRSVFALRLVQVPQLRYMTAAVGGTDKMNAETAVGTVRTYARIDPQREFSYEAWKDAIRRAHTFVTYGPLIEFAVDGGRRARESQCQAAEEG